MGRRIGYARVSAEDRDLSIQKSALDRDCCATVFEGKRSSKKRDGRAQLELALEVLAGHLRWSDYRPPERPNHVRIVHHKTGEVVWHPLEAGNERFYPELEDLLAGPTKIAVPIVATSGERGAARPYSFS